MGDLATEACEVFRAAYRDSLPRHWVEPEDHEIAQEEAMEAVVALIRERIESEHSPSLPRAA